MLHLAVILNPYFLLDNDFAAARARFYGQCSKCFLCVDLAPRAVTVPFQGFISPQGVTTNINRSKHKKNYDRGSTYMK